MSATSPRLRRRQIQGDSADGEFLWLISLSDFLLLLFIFFVALFSFTAQNISREEFLKFRTEILAIEKEPNAITDAQNDLQRWLSEQNLNEAVKMNPVGSGLRIELQESLLFASGSTQIAPEAKTLLELINRLFSALPPSTHMAIHGHTDRTPIRPGSKRALDNFELGAQRALAVLRAMALTPILRSRTKIVSHGPNQIADRRVQIIFE